MRFRNAVRTLREARTVQLADSELQIGGDSMQFAACPALYWYKRGAHLIVGKVAADCYRCQFY